MKKFCDAFPLSEGELEKYAARRRTEVVPAGTPFRTDPWGGAIRTNLIAVEETSEGVMMTLEDIAVPGVPPGTIRRRMRTATAFYDL